MTTRPPTTPKQAATEQGLRAHRSLLGKLKPEITEVDLGPGKGIYFRLKVGPVEDPASAAELCRKLKSRRQFCEPTIIGAG